MKAPEHNLLHDGFAASCMDLGYPPLPPLFLLLLLFPGDTEKEAGSASGVGLSLEIGLLCTLSICSVGGGAHMPH